MAKSKGGRKSAVEISPYRKEIEEMLREGKKPDFIETWIKNIAKDESDYISRSAIYRYKNDKFNIQAEAVQKYNDEKSKERLDEASDEIVSDIKYLDNVIDIANKVKLEHDNLKASEDISKLDIEKHKLNIIKAGYQCVKIRSDSLKKDPNPPGFNVFNLNGFDEDELKLAKEFAQKLAEPENYEEFDESVDSEDIS